MRRYARRLPRGPGGLEASRFLMGGNLEGTPAFLLRLRERFGPVTQFRLLTRRIWVANEPAVIRDVLVTKHQAFEKSRGSVRLKRLLGEGLLTSEEPLHLRQRRLLQPAFHRDRLALYGSEMVEEAEHQVESWHDGDTVDVVDAMTRLTLVIATRTLFGSNIGRETEEVRAALSVAMELFPRSLSPASELLDRLPIPATRQFARARSRLDAVVGRLVAKRRESGIDTGDLLSMLLLARDAVDGQSGMSDAQVRDEAMTIFLAGHETTANALAWTLYLLSEHPRVRERLEDEVDAALAGRAASAEDVPRLPYARSVLSESMRLFPPAWIVGRRALRDVAVGGYELRRGEVVLMSQYVVHRDPRFYDEPEAFRPERWSSVAAQALPRFAYFPFGAGNRVCIGEQFAWMEGLLVLTALTRRWRLDLVPGTPVALQPVVTLRPRYPMPMVVHARSAHASASRDGSVRGDRKAPSERVGAECTLATAGAPRRVQSRMDPATTALETETATFAGGCFWGVESDFRSIPGVLDAVSGYTGGTMPDPTYRAVCSDRTGHAEAVRVTYDPSRVSYRQLVEAFWKLHDPTTPNRQGPDVGSQYRSAIFTHSPEQTAVAEESKREAQARFSRPIVTQIVPATEFYPAEDYHQRYFEKQGITRH